MEKRRSIRTIIVRKDEIPYGELKRENRLLHQDGIYAVCYKDEGSDVWQWGIIALYEKEPVLSYNVASPYAWYEGGITNKKLHYYDATMAEIQMVRDYRTMQNLTRLSKQYLQRVKTYEDSRWHQIAERLRKFF